jgi:hypothetical protein
MHHRFRVWEGADRTYLAEDRHKCRALVNMEMYTFHSRTAILILSDFLFTN